MRRDKSAAFRLQRRPKFSNITVKPNTHACRGILQPEDRAPVAELTRLAHFGRRQNGHFCPENQEEYEVQIMLTLAKDSPLALNCSSFRASCLPGDW
jgi:hypothetical protein